MGAARDLRLMAERAPTATPPTGHRMVPPLGANFDRQPSPTRLTFDISRDSNAARRRAPSMNQPDCITAEEDGPDDLEGPARTYGAAHPAHDHLS
jgi:hypothetical protein